MKRVRKETKPVKKPVVARLFEKEPIQFERQDVYEVMTMLNEGKYVSKKTLVKMLYQLQYQLVEYQSLVTNLGCCEKTFARLIDRHRSLAYYNKKETK